MSPRFPGMDPFLEAPPLWPRFQRQLVAALYQTLLPGLADRYRARVGARTYTAEITLFTSIQREEHAEEFVEIRSRADGRLVTLIEVLSPGNRTTPAGRDAYLAARAAALGVRAAVVEIDLLTAGRPPLDLPRATLPDYDYLVTVTRGGAPDRHELYPAPLPKRLPKFKVPLAADDRDTVLDLQLAVWRAVDGSAAFGQIPYAGGLPRDSGLSAERREWVAKWLAQNSATP